MSEFTKADHDDFMQKAAIGQRLRIPFYGSLVRAGFPSPAENYVERVCDLNDLCVSNAEATYFVRVTGDSMTGDRIEPGDILIVDSSREVVDGKICVVWINGEHTVKRVHYAGGPSHGDMIVLMPSNPKYMQIEQQGIRMFSSNYTLYGDMSSRVMATLGRLAEQVPHLLL